MSEYEVIYMLGYLNEDKWFNAIKDARNKTNHCNERRLWELVAEQDASWEGNMEKEIKERLREYHQKKLRTFIVNSKDLFDKEKNPKLSLSAEDILKNKKIKKERS